VATSAHIEPLWEAVLLLGSGIGASFPVGIALISDSVPQSLRGYAMGIFETCCEAGYMAAGTIGGFLAEFYSSRAPYLLAAIVSLSSAGILTLMLPRAKGWKRGTGIPLEQRRQSTSEAVGPRTSPDRWPCMTP
jgi:MFS family permease